ncbi:MAG: carboxy-S-adenosyl-L-methionine synthase CmoA [Pseudomonadales bacterium]
MSRDRVFSEPRAQIVDFVFDEAVADVFPDMIRRSVPGYELIVPMTGLLAARAAAGVDQPRVYDLGCSLGATTLAVLHAAAALGMQAPDLSVVAVDNSPAMLDQARRTVTDPRVTFLEADVTTLPLEPARAVIMNWVLQFLAPHSRGPLLTRIRKSLQAGGVLLLAEKVHDDDPEAEAFNQAVHLDFKRANGYSELEISQKRTALEQVLLTDTIDAHVSRLQAAGFREVHVWFQCLNWAAFAARA